MTKSKPKAFRDFKVDPVLKIDKTFNKQAESMEGPLTNTFLLNTILMVGKSGQKREKSPLSSQIFVPIMRSEFKEKN